MNPNLNSIYKLTVILVLTSAILSGCTTKFFGSPHIERKACEEKCASWDMELSGMVAMGEYSSGCVCKEKERMSKKSALNENSVGAVAGAAIGVVVLAEEEEVQRMNGQSYMQ